MGLGLMRQNSALDVAAQAHAEYLASGSAAGASPHEQVPGQPGFTGVGPLDRATAAGYSGSVGEVVADIGGAVAFGDFMGVCVEAWLGTSPGHANVLASSTREVGVGVARVPNTGGYERYRCVVVVGIATGSAGQLPAAASVVAAYPVDGQFDVWTYGSYVWVRLDAYETRFTNGPFSVSRFVLKDRDGNLVPAQLMANPTVTAGPGVTLAAPSAVISPGMVLLRPLSPLVHGQRYSAEFVGAAAGVVRSRTWTFTATTNEYL